MFSRIFSFGSQFLCPSIQPSFTNAVSVVMSFRKMIPVFSRSRPAEYMFGFSEPLIVCAVAATIIPCEIAFLIFGSQLNFAFFAGTCPIPASSIMIPLYPSD
jgi:hypothetical protein